MVTPEMTPEERLLELKKMGRAGKLWRIEVLGKIGNEHHRYYQSNKTREELQQFRDYMYRVGIMLEKDPGHFVVIHPADILEVHMYKQTFYFET
jgi:hypothetical protein